MSGWDGFPGRRGTGRLSMTALPATESRHLVIGKAVLGVITLVLISLAGCAVASDVEEGEDGVYMISARAAPIRGGTTGAHTVAYEDAQKFCATKGGRPIVLSGNERDVYQSFGGASWGAYGGGASSGTFAAGTVNLRFRCEPSTADVRSTRNRSNSSSPE